MKNNLLIVAGLLFSLSSYAQRVEPLPDQMIYPGNPFAINIVISRSDSSSTSSAVLNYNLYGFQVEQPNQPTVSRSGRLMTISWSATQTKALPVGVRLWLEVKAGPIVRQGAFVVVSKYPIKITQPGTFIVASPTVELSETGSTSRTWVLNNVPPSGYRITHNKGTKLVTAVFYRDDTGEVDKLWDIKRPTDMSVEVVGPPGEVFPGRVVLSFPIQTISN